MMSPRLPLPPLSLAKISMPLAMGLPRPEKTSRESISRRVA